VDKERMMQGKNPNQDFREATLGSELFRAE